MHLLFVDESGNPTPPEKSGSEYFVLGGVIIPDGTWSKIKQRFDSLKKQYSVEGEIKWRYFSPSSSNKKNTLGHLDSGQKNKLRIELLSILMQFNAVTIISVLCHTPSWYLEQHDSEALYHRAYKTLIERFQYYLQDASRSFGEQFNGLVICDHRDSRSDARLRDLHASLVSNTAPHSSNHGNIVEGLLLAPSHHSIGIQLADLVAGTIYRKFSAGDSPLYDLIKPSMRQSRQGVIKGYGLAVIPQNHKISDI